MKKIDKIIVLVSLILFAFLNGFAQSFKVINTIPHLPSYATNGSVASPSVGMMIYNQATARPEIYTGSAWVSFENARYKSSTSNDFLEVNDGIPILPSFASAKSSDSEVVPKGTIFYNSTAEQIQVWDGSAWRSIFQISISESLTEGSSFELNMNVDGLQVPVLASAPGGCEQGAIYIDSNSKLINSFDGTSWNEYTLNFVPVASGVQQTGNVWVGQTLTGSYLYSDNENDTEGTSTFRWYRSDSSNGSSASVISGATSSTYIIQSGDLGKYIGFAVTPVASTGESPGNESIASGFSGPVGTNDPPVASNVSQSGNAEPGQTLTGSYTYSDTESDLEGASLYKWYRADDASGANEVLHIEASNSVQSYTVQAGDAGYYLRFGVIPVAATGSSPGAEVVSSSYIGPIISNAVPVASNVTQSGSTMLYGELSGSYTYSDADGDAEGTSVYKWYTSTSSNGSSPSLIGSATSSTYSTGDDDIGMYIGFSVTPAASTGSSPGAEVISSTFSGPISSSWTCGNPLTASHSAGTVAPATVTISYGTRNDISNSSKCWITQNLGASSTHSDPTSPVSSSAYGWFWQFNRKQGYIAGEGWGGESIDENSAWTSANDPCTLLLGASWRLPTLSEWGELHFSDAYQDYPYWNNLNPYDAGYLDYSFQFHFPGSYAYTSGVYPNPKYWSNQQNSNTEGVYNTSQMPGVSLTMTKNNGLPVRCLKD